MMSLKPGVDMRGLHPEALAAMFIADGVFTSLLSPLVITAVKNGKHKKGSLHYVGQAFDARLPSRYVIGNVDRNVVEALKAALGVQYDVVLEEDHIHVEFDPKET